MHYWTSLRNKLMKKGMTHEQASRIVVSMARKSALKDSDGDGVPDVVDCDPKNPKKQDEYKVFPLKDGYQIIARWEKTRNGFRHVAVLMKDGYEIGKAKANYLNRTWESYEYQSVIHELLDDSETLSEKQKKEFKELASGKAHKEVEEKFGTIARVAKLGEIFGTTPKEKTDWKKRMLKAGLPALDFPEDWDTLTEDEKERRLNAVIAHLQKKES
jgi:hypothetical protein